MNWCKFLWGNPCRAIMTLFHWDSCLWDFGFSTHFSHSAAWKNSETDSAVSVFHAYSYRGGNCNCLLSHTARWFSIANNLLEFFVHVVLAFDSWPRHFSHYFHFWRQNYYFVFPAGYFFLPWSSICDNQVQLSSGEFQYCTIPIRSWVSPPNFSARGIDPSIASSARNPLNFGSQAYVALSVFREVSINTVLCVSTFWSITFRIWDLSARGMFGHMRVQVL